MNDSILIADDHPLILKGLSGFLEERNYPVVASATNGRQAWQLIQSLSPHIAILDIQMPFLTGLEVAQKVKEHQLGTRVVLITFEKELKIYEQAKELGVYGYMLKDFALVEIENCIAAVFDGRRYFSPELIAFLQIKEPPAEWNLLTPSEREIVKLVADNHTGVEIATLLCVSPRTVEKHKSNIIKKLNLPPKQNSLLIWVKENQDHFL